MTELNDRPSWPLAILKDAAFKYGDYLLTRRYIRPQRDPQDHTRLNVEIGYLPHKGFSEWFRDCYTSCASATTDT